MYPHLLNILELEDPRSVPFNVYVVYAAGGAILHRRYVKILIIFC
jgi:hypothetical protein